MSKKPKSISTLAKAAATIPAEPRQTLREMLLTDPTAAHMVRDFFRCHSDGLGWDVTAEGMDATADTLKGMLLVAEAVKAYAAD